MMPLRIEDYAIIGDRRTAALVGTDGSVDWLCLPRFDSASVFGALLGYGEHGAWRIAPVDAVVGAERAYEEDMVVLRQHWRTDAGEVVVTDAMSFSAGRSHVIRRVTGVRGVVRMRAELTIRFGYASAMPWVRQTRGDGISEIIAMAGPDALVLRGPEMRAEGMRHIAEFEVLEGTSTDLVLTWFPSSEAVPAPIDVDTELDEVIADWRRWVRQARVPGEYADEVRRSLATLRALTSRDTGGIVAAATTSLPERTGAGRNWDYRYVWLRDASLTLGTLLHHGLTHEAQRWRDWLLRAVAGSPTDVRIVYGIAGERDLLEREIDTLPGYLGSGPVRIGNGAASQYQADVFGELFIALRAARRHGLDEDGWSWNLQRAILRSLERLWRRPDRGMWEVRGAPRAFTCSRAMLWAAFQCGVEAVEDGLPGPAGRWAALRDEIRSEIEREGVDPVSGSFVQFYGGTAIDANLLLLADIGFVAPDDPRMLDTVRRIEEELMPDGLVLRYDASTGVDGVEGGEHPFLPCSFWLVEQYARSGRTRDARTLMRRVLACAGDVGQLSEEFDPVAGRQMGNTPQAFTTWLSSAPRTRSPIPSERPLTVRRVRDRPRGVFPAERRSVLESAGRGEPPGAFGLTVQAFAELEVLEGHEWTGTAPDPHGVGAVLRAVLRKPLGGPRTQRAGRELARLATAPVGPRDSSRHSHVMVIPDGGFQRRSWSRVVTSMKI